MVGFEFLSARVDTIGGLVVVVDQAFGLCEQKVSMFVCRSEVEGISCRSALSLLGGRSGEDVCEEGAKVGVKVRVEVRSSRWSAGYYFTRADDGLQLALFGVKHLVKVVCIFVDLLAHGVDPAIIFVLEATNERHHLLTLDTALVFFLFRCALVVHVFAICSALG